MKQRSTHFLEGSLRLAGQRHSSQYGDQKPEKMHENDWSWTKDNELFLQEMTLIGGLN